MFDEKILETLPLLSLPNTDPKELTGISASQSFLNQYYNYIESLWWHMFFITCALVIFITVRKIMLQKQVAERSIDSPPNDLNLSYEKIFFIAEIKKSQTLKLMGGAILLGHLINYYFLVQAQTGTLNGVEAGINVCWPFFQNCQSIIFLRAFPDSHMQRIIYAFLFFIIVYAAKALLENKITQAHALILILFIWHLYVTMTSYSQFMHVGAYTYYILSFSFIFVFCSNKRFFFCLAFVFFYFLSVTTKMSDTWILGTYFSAEKAGAPLFSNDLIPFATNAVILIQITLPWFLISKHSCIQRTAFFTFCLFHVYATFIVLYHYSIIAIPAFLILFGKRFKSFDRIPTHPKSLIGWFLIGFLCIIQAVPHIISSDRWITLQGGFYGMYMIEANHQCDIKIYDEGKLVSHIQHSKPSYRCDPYIIVTNAQNTLCKNYPNKKLPIKFLHSLNGGPFYEIINEDDVCALKYKAFSHNEWIKTRETAPALYRPNKN